jgi:hypothetical protein
MKDEKICDKVVNFCEAEERIVCGGEYIKICDLGKNANFQSLYQCNGCMKIKAL